MPSDYSSMATALIPGALGLLVGGPAGAAGALASSAERGRLQEKEAQAQALKEREMTAQEQRWGMLNRVAEENMKTDALQRQQLELTIGEATRSKEARERYRATLAPDKQELFDLDPKEFIERTLDEDRVRGAGRLLQQFGIKEGEELARIMGPKGVGQLLDSALKARLTSRDRFWFHFDANSGQLFSGDQTTGAIQGKRLVDPKVPVEDRVKVREQMRKEWAATHQIESQLPQAQELWEDYADSAEGQLKEAYLLRRIQPEVYRKAMDGVRRQDQSDQAAAAEKMKAAYMGVGPQQTEAGFQSYLQSPEGEAMLQEYKRAVKREGRQPTAEPPSHPVRMDRPAATAQPGPKTATAPQAPPKTWEEWKRMRESRPG